MSIGYGKNYDGWSTQHFCHSKQHKKNNLQNA